MTGTRKGLGALALVAMLLISAMGGVAAIGVDTETTTSSSTSDLQDGDTINVTATSTSERTLQLTNATADAAVHVKSDTDGDGTKETVATFDDMTKVADGQYKTNISDKEIRQNIPVTADGQADSWTFELVNDTTVDSPTTSTITVSTNASGVSTVEAGSDATAEDAETLPFLDSNLLGPDTSASYDADGITASSGDVVIVEAQNSDYADAFTGIVGSDAAEGAVVPATVQVNGNYEEVYYKSAPDAASGTYTVLEDDGDLRVHVSDDFDESSIDVSTSTDNLGFMDAFSVYGVGIDGKALDAALPF